MNLLNALEDQELSPEQGWSTANRYIDSNESFAALHDIPVDVWPQLNHAVNTYSPPNNGAAYQSNKNDQNMSVEESHSTMWKPPKNAVEFPAYTHRGSSKHPVQVQYTYAEDQAMAGQQFYSSQPFEIQSSSSPISEETSSQNTLSQMEYLESQEAALALKDFMESSTQSPQSSLSSTGSLDYQNTKQLYSPLGRQIEEHIEVKSSPHRGSVVAALLQKQTHSNMSQLPQAVYSETSTVPTAQSVKGRVANSMSSQSQANTIPPQHERQMVGLLRTPGNQTESAIQAQLMNNPNKHFQNQQMIFSQNEQNIHSQNLQDRHQMHKNVHSLTPNIQFQTAQTQLQQGLQQKLVNYQQQLQNAQTFQPQAQPVSSYHQILQDQQGIHSQSVLHPRLETAGATMNSHLKQGQLPMNTNGKASLNVNHSFMNLNPNPSDTLVTSNRCASSFTPSKSQIDVSSKLENILRKGHFVQSDSSDKCEPQMQNGPYYDSNNSNLKMVNMHNINSIQQESKYPYSPTCNVSTPYQFERQNSVQQQFESFSPSSNYSSSDSQYGSQGLDYQQTRLSISDTISVNSPTIGSPASYSSAQYIQSSPSSIGTSQSSSSGNSGINENHKCVNYAFPNHYSQHSDSPKTGQMQPKYNRAVQSQVISNLKVIGGSLEKDVVYSIKSSSGKRICASWNGETFETVDQSVVPEQLEAQLASMYGTNRECMLGGGSRRENRGRPLKGNATGMHLTSNEQRGQMRTGPRIKAPMLQPANYMDKLEESKVLLPNGRVWQHTSSLVRRPLHPENEKMCSVPASTVSGNEVTDPNNKNKSEVPDLQETIPPKPPRKRYTSNGEELLAVCKFCGYTSSDLDNCERCSRKLPEDAKLTTLSKKTKPETKGRNSDSAISKKSFYGKVMSDQFSPYKSDNIVKPSQSPLQVEPDSPVSLNDKGLSRVMKGRPGRKPAQNKLKSPKPSKPRSKKRKTLVPVTVTISSDEEGDPNSSQSVKDVTSTSISQSSTSTEPDSGSANPTKSEEDVEDEFPIFSTDTKQPISRRGMMEDELGRLVKKSKKKDVIDEIEMPSCDTTEIDTMVQIDARSVRIGALKLIPTENILMTNQCIQFCLLCETTKERYILEVAASEMENCQGYFRHPLPLLFILTTAACGIKLRKQLKKGKQEFFDPKSADLKVKYIVIIINKMEENDKQDVRLLLQHYSIHKKKRNFFVEISLEESQLLLVKTTPQVNENVKDLCNRALTTKEEEKEKRAVSPSTLSNTEETSEDGCRSRSASPLRIGFSGTIEKLVTYPPPPAPRGITITNEDLFCLNDGEFLNDVIIDFYLKYLYLEKLSDQERKRIHIFSSFFYKCLTQKQPRNSLPENVAKKSPAIRRHSRVKTWTRHADLFEKDFVLIPINEHAHWFLAIICFPGLKEHLWHPFQPRISSGGSNSSEQSQNSEQMDSSEAGRDGTNDSSNEEDGSFKEIRGTPVDVQKCLVGEERSDYNLGLKQPCILILDSLAGPSRTNVIKILKEYIQVEWDSKKSEKRNLREALKGGNVKVPQQTNYSDCGVYVLQYAECFLCDKIMDYNLPMKGLKTWFKDEVVLRKRDEIRELILDLSKRSQNDTNNAS